MKTLRGCMHWLPEGYFTMHWPESISAVSIDFIEEHMAHWLKAMRRVTAMQDAPPTDGRGPDRDMLYSREDLAEIAVSQTKRLIDLQHDIENEKGSPKSNGSD